MPKQLSFKTRIFNSLREVGKWRPLEQLLVKLTQDKHPRSAVARFIPNNYQYPKGSWRECQRDGLTFRLDISEYMEHAFYYGLKVEPREALYSLAKPGMVVVDVGVNFGETLLHFAQRVGPQGAVHGFEPVPFLYERAHHNLSMNGFSNVQLNNEALSDQPGALFFETPNLYNSGEIKMHKSAGPAMKEVSSDTLDHYVATRGLDRLDLIKIDVEGFEFNVLKGAKASLQRFQPALFIELNDTHLREQHSSARELVAFLEGLGYRIRRAEGEAVSAQDDFSHCHFDILALHV